MGGKIEDEREGQSNKHEAGEQAQPIERRGSACGWGRRLFEHAGIIIFERVFVKRWNLYSWR